MALDYKIAGGMVEDNNGGMVEDNNGGMVEDNNGCDCSCTIFPVDFNSPSLH